MNTVVPIADPTTKSISKSNAWLLSFPSGFWNPSRILPVAYSFADQGLAVGGSFLANVVLARTQTKEEYGMFALSYSIFTFIAGLHNSAILEPCTVYGSGRYQDRFRQYLSLIIRINTYVGLVLTGLVLLIYVMLRLVAPALALRSLLGLGVTVGILLSAAFLRRVFYLRRQAAFAAQASFICFVTIACCLWVATKAQVLNGFSVFLILALGWITAGIGLHKKIAISTDEESFLVSEPGYWYEHWKYSRWVLGTAFVFQLAMQGYYWLLAGLLSVKQVAELRAMYVLVAPMDQIFIALSLLFIPALASHYAARRMTSFFSLWKQFALGVGGLTIFFAVLVRVLGKPAMHILYAGRFDGLAPILYILALMPLVMGIGATISSLLNAAERPKLVFFAYASSGAMTFVAGIPLVIRFGLRGAAYGMLLSGVVCTAVLVGGFLSTVADKPALPGGLGA